MSSARCSHVLMLAALRGAERIMPSFYFHLWSFSFLSQVFCRIDVVSHYFKVPVNPLFIRPHVLIHFFSRHTSLRLSGHCFLIPVFFFFSLPFFHSEGNVSFYLCSESGSYRGKGEQGMGLHAIKGFTFYLLWTRIW